MKKPPGSRLEPSHEIHAGAATSVVMQPAKSKQRPSTAVLSQAESLLAAEKGTLEMMANGASLPAALNDLCAAFYSPASPAASMVCLMDPDGKHLSPCAGPRIPEAFTAA